ncbi:MAG: ZIP family metal transporter [Desulfovibrio sp.]|nr:ZIP family metal transporter [Desulfovibrio sp.]
MEIIAHPAIQALIAGLCSWFAVSVGAALIFSRQQFSRKAMDCFLGGAGGMMLAAAFFGLLQPAFELTTHLETWAFVPVTVGLLLGAAFLLGLDRIMPHIHNMQDQPEGLNTRWRRSILLVTAMALHHIPEGLAMGVGYGAAAAQGLAEQGVASLGAALVLTLSLMLQGVPEGLVVATALRGEGVTARNAFLFGSLSGLTAPLGALPGALAAEMTAALLPVALAFAAGAMIYVVVEEVIPEANASGNGNAATLSCIAGLCLVMIISSLLE